MSQDDGSDSEPELVVQPRGHWDKTLAVGVQRGKVIVVVVYSGAGMYLLGVVEVRERYGCYAMGRTDGCLDSGV